MLRLTARAPNCKARPAFGISRRRADLRRCFSFPRTPRNKHRRETSPTTPWARDIQPSSLPLMASSHTWTVSGERGFTRAWPTAHRHVAAPVPLSHRRLISGKVRQKTPMVRGRPPERYPLATIAGVAGAAVFARPSHNRNLPCGFAGSMAPVRGWPGWRGVPVGVSSTGARRPSRTTAPFPPSPRKSRRPCEVPKTPRPTHPALPRLFTCKIQKRGVCARNSRSWPTVASHDSPPFSVTARKQPVMRSRRAAGRAEVPPGRPRSRPRGGAAWPAAWVAVHAASLGLWRGPNRHHRHLVSRGVRTPAFRDAE